MKIILSWCFFLWFFLSESYSAVIPVGANYTYKVLNEAFMIATPGDSIICHDLIIQGGLSVSNLSGTADKWIYIMAASGKTVTIQGGSNSIQFSDCAYLQIEGFTIQGQIGNGMNIDDAGTFNSPTHHIKIKECVFQNINATGNNDLLKLSGLDNFEIVSCIFKNGAVGGSGIDMVGCHSGVIAENYFENMGSNSIQAKGGTSDIQILRNRFENGGARALNLGGSTGLSFFRPQNATSEAENIQVIANVIKGSEASVAFVGCRNVSVSNNTILFPKKWVIRILQETVDVSRFLPCGNNLFYNNIVVVNNDVNTEVNIGPDTAPATFNFTKNLWYKITNIGWQGPNLPGNVSGQIIKDPKFEVGSDVVLSADSPAISAGQSYTFPAKDIFGNIFSNPPSLGAYEAKPVVSSTDDKNIYANIYPNPFDEFLNFEFSDDGIRNISIINMDGKMVKNVISCEQDSTIDARDLKPGMYLISIIQNSRQMIKKIIKHK
ncbi:MAG: T9SS type A sorting domain-containing protein [Saprospiraceae bacterium]|jgi:hypothetical protein|nr:T9SS type A sorting domain-containing protein [Saprospiraceae bacterium]MBP6565978.1 T9SS type A sorting domain-containing protein [Saprospiraceae bacterium]